MRVLHDLPRDVHYAVAGLLRRPLFSVTAIATIGLGLGAATSVFSVVDSIFLRRLPVPTGDRLIRVEFYRPGRNPALGLAGVRILRERATAFDAVVAHDSRSVVHIQIGDRSVEADGAFASANYWSALGLRARLGRFFLPREDSVVDRDAVAVVSSAFWHAQLGDDPAVVGRHIRITDREVTIIGVAPEGFQGIAVGEMPNDIWMPFMMAHLAHMDCIIEPYCRTGEALARLAPHATREMAEAQVRTLATSLSSVAFGDDSLRRVMTEPALGLTSIERQQYLPLVELLSAIAALLLLIACANVSGLLVARGVSRHREMAVRVSLGASRWRLARQLLTESLLVAAAGGVVGLVIAAWISQALLGFFATDDEGFHHFFDLALDGHVVAFTVLLSTATVVLFGLLPALTTSRVNPAATLKTGAVGAGQARTRVALVSSQVALSVVLLTAATLLARSFANLMSARSYDPNHVAVLRWRPDLVNHTTDRSARELREIVTQLRALPNVEAVGYRRCCGMLWSNAPQSAPAGLSALDTVTMAQHQRVSPDFFATLNVPLLAGREFTDADRDGAPRVAIVNRALASRLWPAVADPTVVVGRDARVGDTHVRVVGVVPDYQARTMLAPTPLVMFEPIWQDGVGDGDVRFAVRVRGDAAAALPLLARTVARVDPEVLVTEVMPMRAQIAADFVQIQLGRTVLFSAAALALFLSGMGLYGVIAFLVARRTREVGIRIALGAPIGSVTRLFIGHGLRAVALGILAGLAAAVWGKQLLGAWLVGVAPNDTLSFGVAVVAVAAVSLLASYLPARQASRTDPAIALRME
jgi:predicted permease